MNLNEQAIDLLEDNEYDEALILFKKAVQQSRDVQSLTNLAWILTHEEDDFDQAIELLIEVIQMKPKSYFPYNLLGEVYMKMEMWQKAATILKQAIAIESTKDASFNLAATLYHLKRFKEAATYYLTSAGNSDYALYGYVRCLINLGEITEAKKILDTFSNDADDFIGEIEIAELYLELGFYEEAASWFNKGYEDYYHQALWVGQYIFSLLQLGQLEKAKAIQLVVFNEKKDALKDERKAECDDDWTEEDKQIEVNKLIKEINQLECMNDWISGKVIPSVKYDSFDPSISSRCYLYGCKRHDHSEYVE